MSLSPRTTPGSERSMKSLVVLDPQRTMMWCQPRRIPSSLSRARAISLALSSDIPGVICSAIMWTALRIRARTAMKSSSLKAVQVPSMVVTSVMVIIPPGELVDLVKVARGLGRDQQHFGARFLGSEAMWKFCVEMHGRAAFEEVER